MVFRPDVVEIMRTLPKIVQNALFSTTMSEEALEKAEKFLRKPVKILLPPNNLLLPTTRQFYIDVQEEKWKIECLCDLYDSFKITQVLFCITVLILQTIIFCNSAQKAAEVAREMNKRNNRVITVHEDLNEQQQAAIIDTFVAGRSELGNS